MNDNEKPTMRTAHRLDGHCQCEICTGHNARARENLDQLLLSTFAHQSWAHVLFLRERAGLRWDQIMQRLAWLQDMARSQMMGEIRKADLATAEKLIQEGKL